MPIRSAAVSSSCCRRCSTPRGAGAKGLDLAALIRSVQKPPFDKVGVFDLESFFPARDRTELALRINGLLASPGFAAWLEGDALDVQSTALRARTASRASRSCRSRT